MNGKNHERLNTLPLPLVALYLGYYHSGTLIECLFAAGFLASWWVHTKYITPDLDTKSRATKRLWVLGWVINKIFKHRGLLHSFFLWAVIFVVEYYCLGWWTAGGVFPIVSHLVTDKF